MKKILLLLLVASSCQLTHTPKTYKRNTYVFSSATTYKELHYTFTVTEKEDMLQYKYTCKEFADRGISFTYSEEQQSIIWLGEVYRVHKEEPFTIPEMPNVSFRLFETDEGMKYTDAAGFLYFNPDYGLLLSQNNGFSPTLTFLKENNKELAEKLYYYEPYSN